MAKQRTTRRLFRAPMESYRGRHCGCAPGTHAALVECVLRHVRPGEGVLDIGAHSGALLLRLQDAGFSDLTGTDLDTTRFDVPGATFRRLELNRSFADEFGPQRFSLITCTDVIEHLDSPRNFVMQAHRLLHTDGWLAISLPNVAFWEGRIKFLLTGELWGFGARNYRTQRHISPMTVEQLTLMTQELGFQPVEIVTAGSFATPLRRLATLPLAMTLRVIGGRHAFGESLILLAQKRAPDDALRRPEHYRQRWAEAQRPAPAPVGG